MRLESLVFTAAYFDRWKSRTLCMCSTLGHKLLLALWGSDQSPGNSEVQESRSQVNADGSSWGLIPSLNGAACGSSFPSQVTSVLSAPLLFQVRNGHIKRITDNDIQSLVLEIEGTNVSTTYITCPADPKKTLGIKLPFLVMIIKNLKKYFTFEVQVLDDKNVRRRFRASNYQSTTRVKPFICTMPMRLDDGWNQIQFNLSDFTRRAYGTNYIETLRVQIHANCRIRRVYFSDRLYSEDELPAEFKLYLPVQNKAKQ
uniref:Cilia and flagella associated protein 20 n=1 Tax=Cyanistes caeruleus TaxID=156563 RepID=A0A8C0UI68_CYACU